LDITSPHLEVAQAQHHQGEYLQKFPESIELAAFENFLELNLCLEKNLPIDLRRGSSQPKGTCKKEKR
jgi:hypothetical protein